ncbi:TRAP transporter small permease [Mangrovicoccus ximenensis]|uniref:TRAP transporter small permease n=1 Tax=Mangrovicoccus ximenensis TaxID=1911570 RepID=UPI000D385331|nr:TRAP transporter small permease subunit [Mangrovicoccus ximenensis]
MMARIGLPTHGQGRARALSLLGLAIDGLGLSGKIVAAAAIAFMFAALLVNVVLRYAFGSGIAWAYEIHAILLPWLVAGGLLVAASQGRNIAISLLPDLLGEGPRRGLLILIELLVLVIALSVLDSSQPILKAAKFQKLSTLGISQIWGYASLVYAFGGMAAIACLDLLRLLLGRAVSLHAPEQSSLS